MCGWRKECIQRTQPPYCEKERQSGKTQKLFLHSKFFKFSFLVLKYLSSENCVDIPKYYKYFMSEMLRKVKLIFK